MASFADFTPEDFPDYDATPEELQPPTEMPPGYDPETPDTDAPFQFDSNEEPDPPGAGDSYQGTDPTAFSEQEGVIDEQASAAPDAQTLGQSDDPEAQEAVGDEAEGDDEDDTSDPSQVDSGVAIDATDEIRFPEQGQDAQETTIREPESIDPQSYSGPASVLVTEPGIFELVQELIEWQARRQDQLVADLIDFRNKMLQDELDTIAAIPEDIYDYILDIDDKITNQLANFAFDDIENAELDGEDDDDLGDGFTTPSLLTEMADIIGGVDQDTYLTSFQWLNADDI